MDWNETNQKLMKRFEFGDFSSVQQFITQLMELFEQVNHHPDVTFGWGYVEISTYSHDTGDITDRDRKLADKIDELAERS